MQAKILMMMVGLLAGISSAFALDGDWRGAFISVLNDEQPLSYFGETANRPRSFARTKSHPHSQVDKNTRNSVWPTRRMFHLPKKAFVVLMGQQPSFDVAHHHQHGPSVSEKIFSRLGRGISWIFQKTQTVFKKIKSFFSRRAI